MQRILKFPIAVTDKQVLPLPPGSKILKVAFQRQQLCLWVLMPLDVGGEVPHEIFVIGTGHLIDYLEDKHEHIGTVFEHNGALVWHVFAGKV